MRARIHRNTRQGRRALVPDDLSAFLDRVRQGQMLPRRLVLAACREMRVPSSVQQPSEISQVVWFGHTTAPELRIRRFVERRMMLKVQMNASTPRDAAWSRYFQPPSTGSSPDR